MANEPACIGHRKRVRWQLQTAAFFSKKSEANKNADFTNRK